MKTLATLVIGIGAIALVACGGSDSKSEASPTPSAISPNSTASASPSIAATTSAASPAATATTAATTAPTLAPTQASAATPVPPTAVPPPPTQPSGAPASATVSADALTFSPTSVTIRAGGTVTWLWSVKQFHNIAVGGFPPSETTNTGPASQVFGSAGIYPYLCEVHPDTMRGTVTVQ